MSHEVEDDAAMQPPADEQAQGLEPLDDTSVDSPEPDANGNEDDEGDGDEGDGDEGDGVYAKLAAEEKKYRLGLAAATETIEALQTQITKTQRHVIESLGQNNYSTAFQQSHLVWHVITPDECLDEQGKLDTKYALERIKFAAAKLQLKPRFAALRFGTNGALVKPGSSLQHIFESVIAERAQW